MGRINALADAEAVVTLKRPWTRGHYRYVPYISHMAQNCQTTHQGRRWEREGGVGLGVGVKVDDLNM